MLIGPVKEKLVVLKTKEAADHAGPSVLLEFLNHSIYSRDKPLIFLNNNSLIAQDHMEIKDAMVDGHQTL